MNDTFLTVQRLLGSDVHVDEEKLQEVVAELEQLLDAEGVAEWLRKPNPFLESRIPLDILEAGDESGEVLDAARETISGSYS